jgi:hypothetical protein
MASFLEKQNQEFETLCISIYPEHLKKIDEIVNRLKKLGYRTSRSHIFRLAIENFDDRWLQNHEQKSVQFREKMRGKP